MASISKLLGQEALLQQELLSVAGGAEPRQEETMFIVPHQQCSPFQVVDGWKAAPLKAWGNKRKRKGVSVQRA